MNHVVLCESDPRIYYIGEGECTQYLLARDGVMVHGSDDNDMPREVGHGIFLTHSSRVDIAISCPGHSSGSAIYEIWHMVEQSRDPDAPLFKQVIGYIEVTGTATTPETSLTPFKPIRPDYLQNLMPGKYEGDWEYQHYEWCDGRGPSAQCYDLPYFKDVEISGIVIFYDICGPRILYISAL